MGHDHLLARDLFFSIASFFLLSLCCPALAKEDTPQKPIMGLYCDVGVKGIQRVENFSKWIGGVPITFGHDSMPPVATWDHIRGQDWLLKPWSDWKKAGKGRRLVLSVAILPGPLNLSGATFGENAHIPVSLEEGAKGTYNQYFKSLAENLIKYGLEDSLLRLGWEMNGDWYTWRVKRGQEEIFAEYWRQIVTTIRSVPGTEKLQFIFNPDIDSSRVDIEKAWPGDEYVDYVGPDIYDVSWLPNTYPIPDDASPAEILERQKKVWDFELNGSRRLNFWSQFAKQHGKFLCFPEWGECDKAVRGHGGGDNPYFIEQMHRFIMDPANNVGFHSYFDCSVPGDKNTNHRISPDPEGKFVTPFPKAAEKFKQLFGAPQP